MDRLPTFSAYISPGNPHLRGRLSTIDLRVTNSFRSAAFDTETLYTFLQKQAILMRRSAVLNLPIQLVFPDYTKGVNVSLGAVAAER